MAPTEPPIFTPTHPEPLLPAPLPASPAPRLNYETAAPDPPAPRPKWVYAILALYALLLAALAVSPVVLPLFLNEPFSVGLAAVVTALLLCELALLFIPVRVATRRPVTRGPLWIPLLVSGFFAALLAVGAGLALTEYWRQTDDHAGLYVLAAAGVVWLLWTLVFWAISRRTGPAAVGSRLHRWLLAGSVLELLVAVPTHVVVRRRDDCCAGIGTGLGICAGLLVMLLAFGPSVAFLYYRRWQQIRPKK